MLRDRGLFGLATLHWRIAINGTQLLPGLEFEHAVGELIFLNGQSEQNLELHVLADGFPEYNELYTVELVNVSGEC